MSDIAIYIVCFFAAFIVYLICDAVKDAIKGVNKEKMAYDEYKHRFGEGKEDKRDGDNKRDKGVY